MVGPSDAGSRDRFAVLGENGLALVAKAWFLKVDETLVPETLKPRRRRGS